MRKKRKKAKRREVQKKISPVKFMFVAALVIGYLALTVDKHGLENGIGITALTWAFFVFLTPLPTADLVLELPMRLLTNHRMVVIHYMAWCLGAAIVIPALVLSPGIFQATTFLSLFYHVLTNPIPYWGLLLLCGMGTLLSVYLMDEVVDEVEDEITHTHRKHMPALYMAVFVLALVGIIFAYNMMISGLQLKGNLELF